MQTSLTCRTPQGRTTSAGDTAAGSVTVLDRSFTGCGEGQLLAVVAALGVGVGVLAVASVGLRPNAI